MTTNNHETPEPTAGRMATRIERLGMGFWLACVLLVGAMGYTAATGHGRGMVGRRARPTNRPATPRG